MCNMFYGWFESFVMVGMYVGEGKVWVDRDNVCASG